jgi:regulatory protein
MTPPRTPRGALRRPAAAAASPADPGGAHRAAVALLARRDFSSGELKEKLLARGFEAEAAAATVEALTAAGALNDARFASNYVAYHAARGQGPVRIAADLRARGLAATLIDSALAEGPDWRARARALRERRFGRAPPASWRERARQGRFLQYRGFSSDHIRAALGADPDTD